MYLPWKVAKFCTCHLISNDLISTHIWFAKLILFPGETPPEPAPRSSLFEDQAKIEVETPKKKKSAKKHHKNKDKHSNNVPSSLHHRNSELLQSSEHEIIPPPPPISPLNQDLRPLSPDSALASSESSGSSLRKQGKVGNSNNNGLFRIVTYQQFKPVLRKSSNIQEKIAIFSRTGQPSSSSMCNSSTTGKTFPTQRQHGNIKVLCPAIKLVYLKKKYLIFDTFFKMLNRRLCIWKT